MKPRQQQIALIGLGAALLAGPAMAASNCGLNMNPATLDRNQDTRLSRAEVAGTPLAGVFGRIDRDQNGAIDPGEFAQRCTSLNASANSRWSDGWNDSLAGQKAGRQTQRQKNRINDRLNRESNDAVDGMVDKAMGALFGD